MRIRWLSVVLVLLIAGASCSRDPNIAKRKYLESGNKYFGKGKYREASIMYRSALKKDIRYGDAYYRLGLTLLKQRDPVSAERAFRRAFELLRPGPDRGDVASKLTDLYLAVYVSDPKKYKTYEIDIKELASRLPEKSFDRLRMEAYVAWQNRDVEGTLAKFKAANEAKPMDPSLILAYTQVLASVNRFEEAEKLARDLIAKDKTYGPVYDVLYIEYARRNRPAEAEQIRKQKSENNPTVILYRLQLASHYVLLNKPDEAARVINAIVSDPKTFPNGKESAGDFYVTFGQFDKAIAYYKGGLSGNKEQKLIFQRKIADALIAQGKPHEALALVENEILKQNPKDSVGLALRASLWLDIGNRSQLQQAVTELEAAVSRMPQNAVVRFNLGRAYWARGDADQARTQFRAALDIQPDYIAPRLALAQINLNKGEYAMALQAANETLKISRSNLQARLIRSAAMQGLGKPEEARADLKSILQANPNAIQARFQLGLLELNSRNYALAERTFQDCLNGSSNNFLCLMGLAEVYSAQKQFDRALDVLWAEQKRSPDRQDLRLAIANTSVQAGRYEAAANMFRELIAKDPGSGDLHLRLGEVYRRMGKMDEAIENFRKVKELQPTNAEAGVWLALLLHQLGRQAEAKAQYEQILKLQPDNPIALNNLAYVIAEQGGDLDVALTYAQRAKQKLPQSLDISDTLGWIYIKKKLTPNALEIYKDLVAKQPNRSTYRFHLGMALFQKGDKPQAKTELEAALRSNPSSEEAGQIKELLLKIG